jgi:hypothetical protein
VGATSEAAKAEFRTYDLPPAVIEAAMREAGSVSPNEFDAAIAAMLAQPDPVGTFLKRTRGRLGTTHRLKY